MVRYWEIVSTFLLLERNETQCTEVKHCPCSANLGCSSVKKKGQRALIILRAGSTEEQHRRFVIVHARLSSAGSCPYRSNDTLSQDQSTTVIFSWSCSGPVTPGSNGSAAHQWGKGARGGGRHNIPAVSNGVTIRSAEAASGADPATRSRGGSSHEIQGWVQL